MGNPEPRPDRPRIFCIGLNKTGTSSFHEAMTILGYESMHHGGVEVESRISAALAANEPVLSRLDQRFDAFSDIGQLSRRFLMLDRQYPGSRFVLTVRPIDAWIDSRRRHVENNIRRRASGEYDGKFVVVDEDKWRQEWARHVGRVHDYFGARDDFIEVDLTHDPGWGALCALLQVPEPVAPFPWANRGRARSAPEVGP